MDKKDMGSRMVKWFLLLLLFFFLYSCKKDNLAVDKGFTGTWVWRQSTEGNSIIADTSSGIQQKLVFTAAGSITITYNDSTGSYPSLLVYATDTLQHDPVMATTTYQLTAFSAPCAPVKIPSLVVQGFGSYQYTLAGDTLLLSGSPCLAPVSSMYVRK